MPYDPVTIKMPAGTYYIGDLCYVIKDESTRYASITSNKLDLSDTDKDKTEAELQELYGELWRVYFTRKYTVGADYRFGYHDGIGLVLGANFTTKHGDGSYADQHRCVYSVDSGSIGALRLNDTYKNKLEEFKQFGRIHCFDNTFICKGLGVKDGDLSNELSAEDYYVMRKKWDGLIDIGGFKINTDPS